MPMPGRKIQRADLPATFTPETLRGVPIAILRPLTNPHNGVLTPDEQAEFDLAFGQLMRQMAQRVSTQFDRSDWDAIVRDANHGGGLAGRHRGIGRDDRNLRRIAKRLEQQLDTAESLAPELDWSFAEPLGQLPASPSDLPPATTPTKTTPTMATPPTTSSDPSPSTDAATHSTGSVDDSQTVSQLEANILDQVEIVQVMSEIAEISKRTFALEQQREKQNTRSVFFGFVVSVAVLVAGWAPIVAATGWHQRVWILGLTVATCLLGGVVYALVRVWQRAQESRREADSSDDPRH